jgi:hypothetical protein
MTVKTVEQKKKELDVLKQSVEDLENSIKAKREARKRERERKDIMVWMENVIFPFLEEIARGFNEPLIPGIKRLIKEGKNPFQPKQDWTRTRETTSYLDAFFTTPHVKALIPLMRPYIKYNMQWIYREAKWIREEILKTEYPDFYEAIMKTEGGNEWLDELINGFMKTIRTYL